MHEFLLHSWYTCTRKTVENPSIILRVRKSFGNVILDIKITLIFPQLLDQILSFSGGSFQNQKMQKFPPMQLRKSQATQILLISYTVRDIGVLFVERLYSRLENPYFLFKYFFIVNTFFLHFVNHVSLICFEGFLVLYRVCSIFK